MATEFSRNVTTHFSRFLAVEGDKQSEDVSLHRPRLGVNPDNLFGRILSGSRKSSKITHFRNFTYALTRENVNFSVGGGT